MKKKFTTLTVIPFLYFIVLSLSVEGQTTITIQPDPLSGKDALIYSHPNDVDNNFGSDPSFEAVAWTWGGTPAWVRSLLQFDLSAIPTNAIITSAKLTLYNNPTSGENNGQHSSQSGSNECVLQRITAAWDESTVTWNNQPTTSSQNELILSQSTSPNQNYPDIDITNWVMDMVQNPGNNHGFMIKLQAEQFYRSMIFASSDNADSNRHPRLDVSYSLSTTINEINVSNSFAVYPNPTKGLIIFERYLKRDNLEISFVNTLGQIVKSFHINGNTSQLDISELPDGIYFYQIINADKRTEIVGIGKLLIQK